MSEAQLDLSSLGDEDLHAMLEQVKIRNNKRKQEESLAEFIRAAWSILEPGTELKWNWHLDVLCAYLEAVRAEKIRRLIINIPPGMMKSLIVSVFYPAWVWTRDAPHRFLCGSNEGTLATRDALKMRQLIDSEWYQENWGDTVSISKEQGEKTLFTNTQQGLRLSQGVTAKVTGKRGDTVIWDDPHDAQGTESDRERENILDRWDNAWSSRLNSANESAVIVIMQRLHAKDITGHLLAYKELKWVNLVIPMEYDPDIIFNADRDIDRPDIVDPRTSPGELLFRGMVDEKAITAQKEVWGPYVTAGQYQQRPTPKGGGELQMSWLNYYTKMPRRGNKIILVDPAGERKPGVKGRRDNTAMGVFSYAPDGNYYLLDGIRDRLNLVERTKQLFEWHEQYRPVAVGYEQYGAQTDIAHIQTQMEQLDYRFKIIELGGKMVKEDRIRRLIPLFAASRIWLPQTMFKTMVDGSARDIIKDIIEEEYGNFPLAEFDDFLDMMSRLCDEDIKTVAPKREPPPLVVVPRRMTDAGVGY
jgi:phage terminase large subunit-like protein